MLPLVSKFKSDILLLQTSLSLIDLIGTGLKVDIKL